MNKRIAIPIVALVLFGLLLLGLGTDQTGTDSETAPIVSMGDDGTVEMLRFGSLVQIHVNGKEHDAVTNTIKTPVGLNAVREALLQGVGNTSAAFKYIGVGNGTVAAGDSILVYEAVRNDGQNITRVAGTVERTGVGNWSISWTFVANSTILINTTGIYNASYNFSGATNGTLLASATFTDASLTSGDTLFVNYTMWVA